MNLDKDNAYYHKSMFGEHAFAGLAPWAYGDVLNQDKDSVYYSQDYLGSSITQVLDSLTKMEATIHMSADLYSFLFLSLLASRCTDLN